MTDLVRHASEFLLYTAPDGAVKVDVLFKDETAWLTQKALAELFGVGVPAITKHLKNIFAEGEHTEIAVLSILETTAAEPIMAPPDEMSIAHYAAELDEALSELKLDEVAGEFQGFVTQLSAWAKERTPQQIKEQLEGTILYDPEAIASLERDATTVPQRKLALAGLYWMTHNVLATVHRKAFRPIEAVQVTIQVASVHPDASVPGQDDVPAMARFCLRLLTEGHAAGVEESPIYHHFGDDWSAADFGGREDDPDGIVPFVRLADWLDIDAEESFFEEHRAEWWAKDEDVSALREPSDNMPYGVATFEVVTFPAWAPKLSKTTFDSRAYG